jgi:hypothetical protein
MDEQQKESPEALPEHPAPPPTTDSAAEAKANGGTGNSLHPRPPGRIARAMPGLARRANTCWKVVKETWDEHDVWVNAMAVKGGLSAILIGALGVLTYVVTLPLIAMAAGIAVCGALLGIGIYGTAAGGAKAWESLRGAYARAMGHAPPEKKKKPAKDILQRLAENPTLTRVRESRLAKKVAQSRAWQMTERLTKKHEDSLLHGMAVGGALLTLALGVSVLATQILVLPVIAVSTIFTVAAVQVISCFASGIYGLYLTGESILRRRREKQAEARAADDGPTPPKAAREIAGPLKPAFDDRAPPVNDNGKTAAPVAPAKKPGPAAP